MTINVAVHEYADLNNFYSSGAIEVKQLKKFMTLIHYHNKFMISHEVEVVLDFQGV